jgi:hypothetical protein
MRGLGGEQLCSEISSVVTTVDIAALARLTELELCVCGK